MAAYDKTAAAPFKSAEGTDMAFEVQCCHVRPGIGQLLITGSTSSRTEECLMVGREVVQHIGPSILARLSATSQAAPLSVDKHEADLHVHVLGPMCPVNHSGYMAAVAICLVSLVV